MSATWESAPGQIAAQLGPLLSAAARIVTLSGSATVMHCLAANAAQIAAITVLESRPGGEGIATARDLAATAAWRVELFPDAAMLLALDGATHVIIGADALLVEGTFANKTGTHPLAQLAHDHALPVIVTAESLKVAPTSWQWQPEHFPVDLMTSEPLPDVTVSVPAFERVPLALATVISERGALGADAITALAATAENGFSILVANRTEK